MPRPGSSPPLTGIPDELPIAPSPGTPTRWRTAHCNSRQLTRRDLGFPFSLEARRKGEHGRNGARGGWANETGGNEQRGERKKKTNRLNSCSPLVPGITSSAASTTLGDVRVVGLVGHFFFWVDRVKEGVGLVAVVVVVVVVVVVFVGAFFPRSVSQVG